jgi:hypothetical protein
MLSKKFLPSPEACSLLQRDGFWGYSEEIFCFCNFELSTSFILIRRSFHFSINILYYNYIFECQNNNFLFSGLPQEIYRLWYKWPYPFNKSVCILQSFSSETSANATVLTITAFTVER